MIIVLTLNFCPHIIHFFQSFDPQSILNIINVHKKSFRFISIDHSFYHLEFSSMLSYQPYFILFLFLEMPYHSFYFYSFNLCFILIVFPLFHFIHIGYFYLLKLNERRFLAFSFCLRFYLIFSTLVTLRNFLINLIWVVFSPLLILVQFFLLLFRFFNPLNQFYLSILFFHFQVSPTPSFRYEYFFGLRFLLMIGFLSLMYPLFQIVH